MGEIALAVIAHCSCRYLAIRSENMGRLASTVSLNFSFDVALEVQYGVFLYAFTLLWWWKWFHSPVQKGYFISDSVAHHIGYDTQ